MDQDSAPSSGKKVFVLRPATEADMPAIYKLQDIPFRDSVYANSLPKYEYFEESALQSIKAGYECYFMFELNGVADGFAQYVREGPVAWDIIVWGKWINTLIYASLKTGFDYLGIELVRSAVRVDNKRVIKAYEKFGIRKTGREMLMYRQGGLKGYLVTANMDYFEMTPEEFHAMEEHLRTQSFEVIFVPRTEPVPVPVFESDSPAPNVETAPSTEPAPNVDTIPNAETAPGIDPATKTEPDADHS